MMAAFLLQRPRLLLLVVGVLLAAGLSAFWVLPRLEDPVLGRRVGIVGTVFPGADAERVESLVTVPIEESLQAVSGIRQVRSNSQTDISNVVIELDDEIVEVDAVWAQVRDRLVEVRSVLPGSCQSPELQVVPLKAFAAILRITPESPQGLTDIRAAVRQLKSALIALPGTESVTVFGDPGEEVVVDLDAARLAEVGLPPTAIASQIAGQKDGRPAGRLREPGGDLALQLRPDGRLEERLARTRVTWGDGESLELDELATVERRLQPATMLALDGGERAIVLGVMVQDDQQIGDWDRQLQNRLAEFRAAQAGTLQARLLFSQAEHVQSRMAGLLRNLGLGTLAVMAVVLLMMGWRSMLVVAAALPLSALMVLAAMRALGIPLHQMSVTGLIVALGLLIDNAIVMVDEVHSRCSQGESPRQAITASIRQLAMPLFGSTLTTVLAFLPIATLPGPTQESFVGTIAVSVILAIVASFVLAVTVIPALSGWLGISHRRSGWLGHGLFIPVLHRLYSAVLRVVLRYPALGVLGGVVFPVIGFVVAGELPEQFFPSSDRRQIQIEVEVASRDSLLRSEQAVQKVAAVVQQEQQVREQHWFVGGSAPTFFYNVVPRRRGAPFYAQAFVDLASTEDLVGLVRRLQEQIDQAVPECRVLVRLLEQGPPFDAPVEVRLTGPDLTTLQQLGRQVRGVLQDTDFVIHTRSDLGETVPGLQLQLDGAALQEARMDEQQTAGLIYTLLEGAPAGTGFEDGEELPVRVRLKLEGPLKQNRLMAMPLPQPPLSVSRRGPGLIPDATARPLNPVTLARVADVTLDARAGAIVHIDGRRACEVKAYATAGVLPSVVLEDFQRRLAASGLQLPDGYELTFGGEKEQRSQAIRQLIANGVVLFR